MARVRAVTVFVSPREWSSESISSYVENAAVKANEIADAIRERIEVWSVRVALPPLPEGVDPVRVAEAAMKAAEANGVKYIAAVHLNVGSIDDVKRFVDAIEVGVYGSVLLPRVEYAGRAAELIMEASKRDIMAPTRLAIVFGASWPLTPYFPIAVQTRSGMGFAVAALYVDDVLASLGEEPSIEMIRYISTRVFSVIEEVSREASERLGIEYYGLDASLSPWMDESVARLIERLMDERKLGSPGTLTVIRELNRVIRGIASSFDAVGFNEVMLPVAEDNVLKERVGEGLVRVRDLLLYSTVCVAGVDMVVVGDNMTKEGLVGLVRDMHSVYKLKGLSIGLRLIMIEGAQPGDWISLGEFGKVPVAWW
ncbi:protein of unknown function DUF711 [Pyrolobus fumarii 1A]|uniref:DUF711 family protein n=1 Tax=Pyrolobus fumarii (strain DSM 11204 / 1A) TaxID=694429 RepID=G0EHQ1_PYRF1|nr:DUF711 family protein [Pyrolobus fumarii]AEM39404.1 protein of unknown function DUF711 [Pyrolobus fumarii 1A]